MRGVAYLLVVLCALMVAADPRLNHIVLTYTGDLSEMQVSFRANIKPRNPAIKYGIGAMTTQLPIPAASIVYFKNGTSKSTPEAYLGTITLTSLTPGSTYLYALITDTANASLSWNASSFKTAPASGYPLRVALFGDMASNSTAFFRNYPGSLINYAANDKIDAVVHFGDIAYNLDSYSGRQGYSFMTNLSPISSKVPYVAGAGNHEYMNNAHVYYQALFSGQRRMGQRSKSDNPLLYFSWNVGNIHFVMINSEFVCTAENRNVTMISAQYKWLEADLAKAQAEGKWIILSQHRQIYSGYYQDFASFMVRAGIQCTDSTWSNCQIKPCSSDTSPSCGWGLERLFLRYKVDMIFVGHIHYYKRHYPMGGNYWEPQPYGNTYYNPQYPVPITTGAAGTDRLAFKKRSIMEEGREVGYDKRQIRAATPGTGLRGYYYSGTAFNTSLANRVDATVDFVWAKGAPPGIPNCPVSGFSVRWTGKVLPKCSGTYNFTTLADDGARLWVNNQLLINDWNNHPATSNSGLIGLTAEVEYDIKLEYYDNVSNASVRLYWQSGSCEPKAIIPQSRLYPEPLPTPKPTTAPTTKPTVAATATPTSTPATAGPTVKASAPPTTKPTATPTLPPKGPVPPDTTAVDPIEGIDSWTLLTIIDDNHLTLQQIATETNQILDTMTIIHQGSQIVTPKFRAFTAFNYSVTTCSQ